MSSLAMEVVMHSRVHNENSRGHLHDHGPKNTHHGHSHAGVPTWLLSLGLTFNFLFFVAAIVMWHNSNSVSILADSLHNLLHSAAYAVAFWGNIRNNTERQAKANLWIGTIIILTALFILAFGGFRIAAPGKIISVYMLIIASLDLFSEFVMVALIGGVSYRKNKISRQFIIRGVLRDIKLDALGSLGVIVAGLLIWTMDFYRADSIAAICMAGIAMYFGRKTIIESVEELAEKPAGVLFWAAPFYRMDYACQRFLSKHIRRIKMAFIKSLYF